MKQKLFQLKDESGTLAGGWQFQAPDDESLQASIEAQELPEGWTWAEVSSLDQIQDNRPMPQEAPNDPGQ